MNRQIAIFLILLLVGQVAIAKSGPVESAYGTHERQRIDLTTPQGEPAPVVLFIHGGGWMIGDKRHGSAEKPDFVTGLGWAYAAANYRLVPDVPVETQARDVAAAIAWLHGHAAVDGRRIVLMGHSAGAHLAALVATDGAYLAEAGVPEDAIDGVVLLDGAGYDVAGRLTRPGMGARLYRRVFGSDPERQRALSPLTHAREPVAKDWLILHVADRSEARDQSILLQKRLELGGARVQRIGLAGETHRSINRELGLPGEESTRAVRAFLAQLN